MYTDIKLVKGIYSVAGKNFTKVLSELDPDSEYNGTELEHLDAFERQLKRFDIKIFGKECDRVERFFLSNESAILFPEYVRRKIKVGMDELSILPEVATAVTYTDSTDFHALNVKSSGDSIIERGGTLPITEVRLADAASSLTKFEHKLYCTYEIICKQSLETFGVILRSLGAQLSRAINAKLINVLKACGTPMSYSGNVTYAELANFWASMKNFDMDVLLCSPAMVAEILVLDEMKYCISDFMSGGKVLTPYGVTLIKCPNLTNGMAIGIDSKCAVEAIFGTDVTVDIDKLITTQFDEIVASVECGFSVLSDGAVRVLTKNA